MWVRQALEKLDTADRDILMLREYEQLSDAEIAELLRLPINTVCSRLFRARILWPKPSVMEWSAILPGALRLEVLRKAA